MASITIRNVDENVKQALRLQAVKRARSMEEHIRCLLSQAAEQEHQTDKARKPMKLADEIAQIMAEAGGGVVLEPYPDRTVDFERLDKFAAWATGDK